MPNANEQISIADIPDYSKPSLQALLGGAWVRRKVVKVKCVRGTKRKYIKIEREWSPRCPEAYRAIKSAINASLSKHTFRQQQLRDELKSEVYLALAKYFENQRNHPKTPGTGDTPPFLECTNRKGWLFTFVHQTAANYFRGLTRQSNSDERIATSLRAGILPMESPAEQNVRKKQEKDCLKFDRYLFERRRSVQKVEDRSWQEQVFEQLEDITEDTGDSWREQVFEQLESIPETPMQEAELRDRESSTEDIDPRLAQIRSELNSLPEEDHEFMLDYLDGRYKHRERVHTPAERKRFQRLCGKIRSRIPKSGHK